MHLPRLRIATQLSLLLTVAVVLAVLAVGGLSVWNLRSGFIDYLRVRDDAQFTRFVQVLERRAAADPSMAWLRDDREAMRDLMDEFNGRPLRGRRPPPGFGRDGMPQHPPPPMATPASNLGDRIVIRDLQGQRLAGRPQPSGARRTIRAIKVDGVDVAMAELVAEPEPEIMDTRFLQRQYAGLAGAGVGTVIIALMIGVWVARRWSRPLRELQLATQRVARGEKIQPLTRSDSPHLHSGAVEIDQLVADVNAMATALSEQEDARRTWIAQISHELRTPLAVLRGELESIEDGARQPTPAVIRSLGEEVAQLNRLVDDLHTLTLADLGQMACEPVAGDANAQLQRMAHKFDARAQQMGLTLRIQPTADAIAVDWDFGRIEQLLSNALENSLRYTSTPGRIEVAWKTTAQTLQLVVQDSAPGVASANLPKLFDPLFRVDASRTRTGQHGSGLGLSIVRAIARAHRGHVQAEPSPLGGLALRVELPLHPHNLERRKPAP